MVHIQRRLLQWSRLLRIDDWWLFHIVPLLTVAYASIAFYALPPALALPRLGRLFLSMLSIAAYAHVVNDLGDIEQDLRAGKRNFVARLRSWQRGGLVLGLLAGGFLAWLGSGMSAGLWALLAAIAILQPLYVCRPIRLKERGAWGLAVDALHTHALPVLFILALFAELASASVWRLFPMAVTVWALLVGIRGILYHQVIDAANDAKSGIVTFVTTYGVTHTRTFVKRFVFPAELVALCLSGIAVFFFAPAIVLFFLCYGGLLLLMRRMNLWNVSWVDPIPATRGAYIPLLAFYRGWPAIGFALLLTLQDWRYSIVLVFHSLIFFQELMDQTYVFRFVVNHATRSPLRVRRLAAKAFSSATKFYSER